MPHLFQKFYRIDNSDTREIGGTGLGLYLCRRLAEVIGGRVWAESVLHAGSTFYLQVPRMNNADATQQIQKQQEKVEQEKNRNEFNESAVKAQSSQPQTEVKPISNAKINVPPPRTADTMPKARTLTPEQIAEYVKKQTALAAAQRAAKTNPLNKPQTDNNGQVAKNT
jgi:hypothetical protein